MGDQCGCRALRQLRNLLAEKARFGLSVVGVAAAVLLVLIVVSLYRGWSNVGRLYERLPGHSTSAAVMSATRWTCSAAGSSSTPCTGAGTGSSRRRS